MTPFRFVRYNLEIMGLLAGYILIPLLPRRLVVSLANLLGRCAYSVATRDRQTAEANVRVAFGKKMPDEEVARIARGSFQCFALVLLDLFWFSIFSKGRTNKYVRIDPGYDWSFGDRPFVYLSAHFGNWEVLGLATAIRAGRLLSVAAPLKNVFADRLLKGMRKGTGQRIISKHGAVRGLIKELKDGGKVALVMDQNTLPDDGGCFVDLFGVPAPVSMAAASLVLHAKCDAAFVCGIPDGKGYYDATVIDRFAADDCRDMSQVELTARIAASLEKAVRMHPSLWLWSYKRWKFIPAGAQLDKFPFYSRPV